jgi:hypothetical protein
MYFYIFHFSSNLTTCFETVAKHNHILILFEKGFSLQE